MEEAKIVDQANQGAVFELVGESGLLPFSKCSLDAIPEAAGVFLLVGSGVEILFISSAGHSEGLRTCLHTLFNRRCWREVTHFKWAATRDTYAAEELANRLIRHFSPPFNRHMPQTVAA